MPKPIKTTRKRAYLVHQTNYHIGQAREDLAKAVGELNKAILEDGDAVQQRRLLEDFEELQDIGRRLEKLTKTLKERLVKGA